MSWKERYNSILKKDGVVEFKTDKTPFMRDLSDDIKDIRRLQNDLSNVMNTFKEVCRKTPQAFITHPIDNNSSVQQTQTSQNQKSQVSDWQWFRQKQPSCWAGRQH